MKYLRKISVLIIAVVFVAAVAIGLGVIFAVKNVNVTLYSYSCTADSDASEAKISEFKTEILNKFRGKLISSVGEENVESALSDGNYYYVALLNKVYT